MSSTCVVEVTTLGYAPNEVAGYIFAIGFGLCGLVAAILGVWKKTWIFSSAVASGCFLECAGYGGRVAMHRNPCNSEAFKLQIVAIILGATILCVGLYLMLKTLINALNPSLSRIEPRWYPIIFIPADISCLAVQAIGGALAASAGGGRSAGNRSIPPNIALMNAGNKTILTGICLQVAVLASFGLIAGDYLYRVKSWIKSGKGTIEIDSLWKRTRFRYFLYAMTGAYAAILVRCIYRIAEMAGGWGNHIMQDEPSFSVLESLMILLSCILLSAFSPGLFIPSVMMTDMPSAHQLGRIVGPRDNVQSS